MLSTVSYKSTIFNVNDINCRSDGEKVITFLIDEEMRSPLHSLHASTVGIGEGNKGRHGIEGIAESLMSRASMQQNLKCITNSLSAAVTDLIPHSSSNGQYHISTDEPAPDDTDGRINIEPRDDVIEADDGDSPIRNSLRKVRNNSLEDINSLHEGRHEDMCTDRDNDEPEDLRQSGRYTVMADSTCQGSTGNSNTPVDQKSPELENEVIDCSRQGHNALGLLSDIADALHRGQNLYRDVRSSDSTVNSDRYREPMLHSEHDKEDGSEPGEIFSDRQHESVERQSAEISGDCHSATSPSTVTPPTKAYPKPNGPASAPPDMSAYLAAAGVMAAAYNSPATSKMDDTAYGLQQAAGNPPLMPARLQTPAIGMTSAALLSGSNMIPTPTTMAFQQQLHQLGMPSVGYPPGNMVKQEGVPHLSPLFISPLQAATAAQLASLETSLRSTPSDVVPQTPPASHMPVTPVSAHSRSPPAPPRAARSSSTGSTSATSTATTKSTNGNKKWQCMFCGIMVSSKFYLSSHVNAVHTRTRVYPCELCGKVFYSHGAQRIHKLRNHWVEKRHKCPHCSQLFVLPFELRQHVQRKHKNIVNNK